MVDTFDSILLTFIIIPITQAQSQKWEYSASGQH